MSFCLVINRTLSNQPLYLLGSSTLSANQPCLKVLCAPMRACARLCLLLLLLFDFVVVSCVCECVCVCVCILSLFFNLLRFLAFALHPHHLLLLNILAWMYYLFWGYRNLLLPFLFSLYFSPCFTCKWARCADRVTCSCLVQSALLLYRSHSPPNSRSFQCGLVTAYQAVHSWSLQQLLALKFLFIQPLYGGTLAIRFLKGDC